LISKAVYLHYLNSLLEGNKEECFNIVSDLLKSETDVDEIYSQLIEKSMDWVGHLWEQNKSTVATEHIATHITQCVLGLIAGNARKNQKTNKSVIVTCVDKEFHELGPQIVSDYFEYLGWTSYFLGASTPSRDILQMIELKNPDLIGVSLNFYMNTLRLLIMLDEIYDEYPDQKIIIGGKALLNGGEKILTKYKNAVYIGSLKGLEEYIKANF